MTRRPRSAKDDVEDYRHKKPTRRNNPPIGLAQDSYEPDTKTYYPKVDPHDSPFIMFLNREKTDEFDVPTVSLHVHESIHPPAILDAVLSKEQTLDDFFGTTRPHNEAVEFYEHEDGWANRMIAGDSLLVMNSLLEKENMGGSIQMIYFDPPYGIKYNSNFQPRVFDMDVKNSVDYVERRPEPIKAFRDTWEYGIHSYLAAIKKRLILAKRLLHDTGSIFVQISTENQHLVRVLLDETFGPENLMWQILFRTKGGGGIGAWPNSYDYILWYAKDRDAAIESGKVHQLWEDRTNNSIRKNFKHMQLSDRTIKSHGGEDIPKGARYCTTMPLHSQGASTTDRSEPHTFPNGTTVHVPDGRHWNLSHDDLNILYEKGRIYFTDKNARLIFYPEDSPRIMNQVWEGMQLSGAGKKYVVQTKDTVLERCIQLSTDVGDLVLDITGGSGVTAYAAEKWGRRWITCDTSRVSLATMRWRLQTSVYPWYKLNNEQEGVDSGFNYETFTKLSAKTLVTSDMKETIRYNKPHIINNKTRITGPFTIESIPAPTISNKTVKVQTRKEWIQMLQDSGIKTKTGRLKFNKVERNGDSKSPIHAFATHNKRVAVSFGPEHGPMGRYQVDTVLADIGYDTDALFIAMTFDPVAKSIIDKTDNAQAVHINNDVLIEDLKSQSTDQPFSMVGEPDIHISQSKNKYTVELRGYDYYDSNKGSVIVGDTQNVAMWMLDTDYDGRTLRVKQTFFPNKIDIYDNLKKTLRNSINPELLEKYTGTKSIPFERGNHRRIAVKIIDTDGNESLKAQGLEEW